QLFELQRADPLEHLPGEFRLALRSPGREVVEFGDGQLAEQAHICAGRAQMLELLVCERFDLYSRRRGGAACSQRRRQNEHPDETACVTHSITDCDSAQPQSTGCAAMQLSGLRIDLDSDPEALHDMALHHGLAEPGKLCNEVRLEIVPSHGERRRTA